MFKERFRISILLSCIIIVLAAIASAGGFFLEDLYRDNELTKTAWFGNDIVTLFLAVPLMIGGLMFSLRGSMKAQLVWLGTLGYMIYNYIFYLYGAAFNAFFLIYVALFTLSTYALIFALIKVDVKRFYESFSTKTPTKLIGGYLIFFAVFLGGMWIASSLSFIATGVVPEAILQTDHPTGVVFATDLALLVPALIVSAILLIKRRAWGYVLSAIVMIKSVAYSLVLMIMTLVSNMKLGVVDPYIAIWIFLSVTCMIALGLLMGNVKEQEKAAKSIL